MKWAEFALKHKYTIFAFILAIIIFGMFSYKSLKTELFPETNPPQVNVITAYPGVSGKDVEEQLSRPLEEEFTTLGGVKNVKSTSQDGLSIIKVEFQYGEDVDTAALDVQNAIDRIKKELPSGVQESQVLKFSSSDKPVITYGLYSKDVDLMTVRSCADNEIKNELQLVNGVAAVDSFGGFKRQINVYIDRERLEALNISLDKVVSALKTRNITEPGGRLTQTDHEYVVRVDNEYRDSRQVENTIIDQKNGRNVLIRDVGRVEDSSQEQRSEFRFKGQKVIGLQIIKREEANTVEVVKAVKQKVRELEKKYPQVKFYLINDDSVFTTQVVENMSGSVRDALIFTAIIVLLFLVTINESLVVAASMPLSILGTFGLMKLFNMELNMVTLSAIILSVGIVVDDAIIVMENIMRHHHDLGKDMKTACIEGTGEIMLADIVGTTTTMIVLIPLLFIEGFVGRTFGPMALTLVFALFSSLVVSLTIIPLFAFLLGQKRWPMAQRPVKLVCQPFNVLLNSLRTFYVTALQMALKVRFLTLTGCVVVLFLSLRLLGVLGMEMMPKLDAGSFFISLQTPPGTSLEKTVQTAARVEDVLKQEKEVIHYSSQIGYEPGGHFLGDSGALGVNQVFTTVLLTSRKERKETIWEIEDRIRQEIGRIPGIETFVVKESGGTAKSTTVAPIDVRITGTQPEVLNHLAGQVRAKLEKIPGAVNIYQSWSLNTPQLDVQVDEDRAAQFGLTPAGIAREVYYSLEGVRASGFDQGSKDDADIYVRYQEENRRNPKDLLNVTLTTPLGFRVPLRDVATISTKQSANLVTREKLEQTVDVLGYTYGRPFSHVMADVDKALADLPVPDGYKVVVAGEQADLQESKADMKISLIMALILVYLLLLAQFKSFVHPVTIMSAVPLVLIGVALALLISGKSISLSAILGLILLVGTVVNNSIVLIDYTIKAREEGMERTQALINAVKIRFRPIMMTASSNVVGMLPLALESALGAERFSPLAITVIGGTVTATLLTMVVIPVVYSLLDDLSGFITGRLSRSRLDSTGPANAVTKK